MKNSGLQVSNSRLANETFLGDRSVFCGVMNAQEGQLNDSWVIVLVVTVAGQKAANRVPLSAKRSQSVGRSAQTRKFESLMDWKSVLESRIKLFADMQSGKEYAGVRIEV